MKKIPDFEKARRVARDALNKTDSVKKIIDVCKVLEVKVPVRIEKVCRTCRFYRDVINKLSIGHCTEFDCDADPNETNRECWKEYRNID